MYNSYGNNVYKKYQVNMGNPYPVKQRKITPIKVDRDPGATVRDKEEEIIENAKRQAEEIIQKATQEANDLLTQAEEKIIAHMMGVEQKAKEEGYRNGEKLAREHYQNLIQEAEDLKRSSEEMVRNTVMNLEYEIVETILEISRKVIGMELYHNTDIIVGLIRKALLDSSLSEDIMITVSPDDYEVALENKEKLIEGLNNVRNVTIKKDSALEKGSCIVETGFGSVDSSVDTQLKAVEDTFREILGGD